MRALTTNVSISPIRGLSQFHYYVVYSAMDSKGPLVVPFIHQQFVRHNVWYLVPPLPQSENQRLITLFKNSIS